MRLWEEELTVFMIAVCVCGVVVVVVQSEAEVIVESKV